MEDKTLDRAPIWDDLTTFDGRAWRGAVDIVSAGFPCQPFSAAGKQLGLDDERWLWPEIAGIIGDVGPALVFLENVPGLVRHGLRPVWSDLRRMGFRVRAGFFSAAEVGAPHRRQRLFVMADATELHSDSGRAQPGREVPEPGDGRGADVDDATGEGLEGWEQPETTWPPQPQSGPTGWPRGLEPAVRRVADGNANRADRLRTLGNGVVPLVAAYAFRTLAAQLEREWRSRLDAN